MRRVPILCVVALLFVPNGAWAQGEPAGPEFRVNTFTTGIQNFPSIAVDSSGNFVVVWRGDGQDGSSGGVFGQRHASTGAPLGPEFRVNTYTTDDQEHQAVASDASGNFVVVWTSGSQDGSASGVFGQRYASSGTPLGPEFRVNTYTTGEQDRPDVASDPMGSFVVVWSSNGQDGSSRDVFGQRYASTGAPLGPEFRVNTYTTYSQRLPAVASDSSGNFVVVWDSGFYFGIFGQRYSSSGATLGSQFFVGSGPCQGACSFLYPSVASDSSGDFVVVWAATDYSPGYESSWIYGRRYASSGGALDSKFRVNTYEPAHKTDPAVAADASGNFVVVWQSTPQDGSGYGVFGQRYLASGAPLGPEFRINTYTTSYQGGPAVAASSSGNFVVVWQSNTQDGSGYGVFGQRYSQIVPVELMHFRVE